MSNSNPHNALRMIKSAAGFMNTKIEALLTPTVMGACLACEGIKPLFDELRQGIRHQPGANDLVFLIKPADGSGFIDILVGMPIVDRNNNLIGNFNFELNWQTNVTGLNLGHFAMMTEGADPARPSTWKTRVMMSMVKDWKKGVDASFSITPKAMPQAARWQATNLLSSWYADTNVFGDEAREDLKTLYGIVSCI